MSEKKVLSKFMILCWATFIAILGHRLGTPAGVNIAFTIRTPARTRVRAAAARSGVGRAFLGPQSS